MENIRAVIFDLDNTLIDRNQAFIKYCAWFIDTHFLFKALPEPKENMINRMILLDGDGYGNKIDMYNELIKSWGLVHCSAEELLNKYVLNFARFTCLVEKANKLLKYLKEKYKLGIITNGLSQTQQGKIDVAGIRHWFDDIIVSGETGVEKPDRLIFEMSCNHLNVNVQNAVYIGDYFKNDVFGASNAGLRVIWLNYKKIQDSNLKKGVHFTEIFKIEDLMEIL
jgi:putative hydrolase of the HAD superfamily